MVLKEIADLGFVIAFRFYGRYPETGPRFYHPPCCESDRFEAEVSTLAASDSVGRRVPVRRPGLTTATSLILPSLSTSGFSEFFSSGACKNFDGVLPSSVPQSVGAHGNHQS